jgi:hypothetical protein
VTPTPAVDQTLCSPTFTAGTPAATDEKPDAKLELTTFAFRVKAQQTLDEFKGVIELYKKASALSFSSLPLIETHCFPAGRVSQQLIKRSG